MAGKADEIGEVAGRALGDVGHTLKPIAEVPIGLMRKQRRNQDGVDEVDEFTGAPHVPGSRDGSQPSGRNDGRDDRGRFTGDGNRPWVDREQIGLDNVAEREGVDVVRDQVASRHPSTGNQIRYFDGLFENADGTYTAVEVKSGSAGRNPAQRLFDGAVSVETPAIANLPNVGPISIVQVILERVP